MLFNVSKISMSRSIFGTKIAKIHGRNRVEAVDIVKVDEQLREIAGSGFSLACDTVLLSVGLIPENELIEMAGVRIG